MTLYSSTSPK